MELIFKHKYIDMTVEDDSDLSLDDTPDKAQDWTAAALGGMVGSFIAPSLCMSAAAFVPDFIQKFNRPAANERPSGVSFSQRLGNLLDELI